MRASVVHLLGPVVLAATLLGASARGTAELRLVDDLRFEQPVRLVSLPIGVEGRAGVLPAVLSAVMPGTGQLLNGEPGKAVLFFGGFATTSIVGLALATVGPDSAPGPSNWLGIGLLGVAVVLYDWGIVDAWIAPGGSGEAGTG